MSTSRQQQPTLLRTPNLLPLATAPTSVVPLPALSAIQWCIFEGRQQIEAMDLHNAAGYRAIATHHGISKTLHKWGPIWFAEQGVRRPWSLYSHAERDELKRRGWAKENLSATVGGAPGAGRVTDPLAGWNGDARQRRARRVRKSRPRREQSSQPESQRKFVFDSFSIANITLWLTLGRTFFSRKLGP